MDVQAKIKEEGRQVEILIVEDSATQAAHLRFLLEEEGFKIAQASNGKDALAMLKSKKPNLVISDIIMPELNGYDLCRAIKDDDKLKDLPVILVTTLSDPQDIINGLECGADNFIRKPYHGSYLMSCVNYLLMNVELRKSQKLKVGMEVCLAGRKHFITAERQQIMDLLISTFEQAVHINSELKQRERDLACSNQYLNGLFRLTDGLNQAVGEREVVETALQRTIEVLEIDSGWISLVQDDGIFRPIGSIGLPAVLQDPDAFEGDCRCRSLLEAGGLESSRNVECQRLKGGPTTHVCVPLTVGRRAVGLMNLVGAGDGGIEEEKLEMLNSIGSQIGVALERAKLHEHLEQLVGERTAKLAAEIDRRKRIQDEQARLVAIIEATPDLVATATPDGRLRYVNQAGLSLIGLQEGADLSDMFIQERYPQWAGKKILEQSIPYAKEHGVWSGETVILGPGGEEIPFLQVIIAHKNKDGDVQYLSTIGRNISQLKAHEARIMRLNRIHSVLSGINTTIVRVRERQELFNEACRIAVDLGRFMFAWIGMLEEGGRKIVPAAKAGGGMLPEAIELASKTPEEAKFPLFSEAIAKGKPAVCNDIERDPRILCSHTVVPDGDFRSVAVFPLTLERRTVGLFALYSSETDVFDKEEMDLLIEMAGDISFSMDHLKKEESLNYLAYFDAVTGLPNRSLFLDRLNQIIGIAHHEQTKIAVVVIDIERFSSINETFGRQGGDELLRQIARHLKTRLDETDVISHLSADYFGVAVRCKHDGDGNAFEVESLMHALQSRHYQISQQELRVQARAGVAVYPVNGVDSETLLHNAEAAMKRSKQIGEKYLFYSPEFNADITEKLSLENKLRRALDQEQFVLHYQPKIDIASGKISGLEALIRWNDPETGLVPPNKFIPLLEETGMIIEAGCWALEKAVSDFRRWREIGLEAPSVAVNVSSIQLHKSDFVDTVKKAVNGFHHDSVKLELEITESLIMQDIEANIRKLNSVREMNVRIAIDDFGTGYSSLSYLTKLPINSLKIDRAFIMNMTSHADDMSIVSTIISLANSLKLRVVAEGVETGEQANILRLLKCDEIQGFLFCKPVPADEIENFLRENKLFTL
ncbi:MAG: EAL domain-containing protein [Gammaproteobacteria bacterium]